MAASVASLATTLLLKKTVPLVFGGEDERGDGMTFACTIFSGESCTEHFFPTRMRWKTWLGQVGSSWCESPNFILLCEVLTVLKLIERCVGGAREGDIVIDDDSDDDSMTLFTLGGDLTGIREGDSAGLGSVIKPR